MVEEVLSEEAEPRHLSQLQTAIDNLQNARYRPSPSILPPFLFLHSLLQSLPSINMSRELHCASSLGCTQSQRCRMCS